MLKEEQANIKGTRFNFQNNNYCDMRNQAYILYKYNRKMAIKSFIIFFKSIEFYDGYLN